MERTTALAIDISKALDSVDHTLLIEKIFFSTLPKPIISWLAAYIRGRTAQCNYFTASSPKRIVRTGVPQGSVISPVIFNHFVSDFPLINSNTTSYADDFTIFTSSSNLQEMETELNNDANTIHQWILNKKLAISVTKSHTTVFTNDSSQLNHHPQVKYKDDLVPVSKNPKILGVHWDPKGTFGFHIKEITKKVIPRLNILKALTGTMRGQSKETIMITYKALIQPIINYACPIWFPSLSKTNAKTLQVLQNKALCIATGCHVMSSESHLHQEAQILPVNEHLTLLCSQFLLSCLRPEHPSHAAVTALSGPRNIRQTLGSKFQPMIEPYIRQGVVPQDSYDRALRELHMASVVSAIENMKTNRVLGRAAYQVDPSEENLSRAYRRTLSQLHSGFCFRLGDYKAHTRGEDGACPDCGHSPQDVCHVFSCPSRPADLTTEDMWLRPELTAEFLESVTWLELPLLRPPPESPPPAQ